MYLNMGVAKNRGKKDDLRRRGIVLKRINEKGKMKKGEKSVKIRLMVELWEREE
jgi:hypothetical protein